MRDVTETWKAFVRQRKQVWICCFVHICLYVIALGLGFWRQPVLAAAIGGANVILYFLLVRGQITGYKTAVTSAAILNGLCEPLEDAKYTGRKGLDRQEFEALGLFPLFDGPNSLLVREGFSGMGFDLELKGWEVSFHYPVHNSARTEYRFMSGSVLTAGRPAAPNENGDWLIVRKGLLDAAALDSFTGEMGLSRSACPIGPIASEFDCYSPGGSPVPRELAKRFEKCLKQAGSLGAVRVKPRQAAVYLVNRFYARRVRLRNLPPSPQQLNCNTLPERDGVWEFFRLWFAAENKSDEH